LALLAHRVGAGEAREEFGTLGLQHGLQQGLQQGLHQAVPVIHLSEEQYHGKASVDDYLKMFPNELLAPNKRVKPIDVRKIEHEDYIDYEIEFIELPAHEENEAGTEDFILKTESSNSKHSDNEIQNDSLQTENTAKKSEKSKELNLVNFVDLVRTTKSKSKSKTSRSRAVGDRRRRRRIKLKRDPGRLLTREINDASNQINTEQTKRDQNNFGETHVFSKPRTIIRNLIQLPETVRKSSVLDRRTNVPRVSNFRARKRIPLKSGRSFYRDDKPSEQLIRLRTSEIIAKLERSNFKERNVIRTKTRSGDDLEDKKLRHVSEGGQKTKTGRGRERERETPPVWPLMVMSRTAGPRQITTTRSTSTQTSSAPLMMYPEVFTNPPQDVPATEVAAVTPPPGVPPLLSVFGTEPRNSRLELSPEVETERPKFPVFTTQPSALKFSIISTSTQTSVPLLQPTTLAVETLASLRNEPSESEISTTKSTTTSISIPTTTLGPETEREIASTTTISGDGMRVSMTEMTDGNVYSTTTQRQEDESKFQEVTTVEDPGSIRTDNHVTTTPVPDDLQLSESITSVYLHNSSVKQSVKKDIKTSEIPNKETVNSIKMLPYSKPVDEVLSPESSPAPTPGTARPVTERVFTVTPVYAPQDGQYHETNPGPYQHDDIGDTAQPYIHDTRANYQHDPTGDTAPAYQHDTAGDVSYSNLDTNYPGDYEVNEVKVDFDNQDEHKIYNVQAKAGDFIIGEVGRIDINNGQTVEGVRYTALQGEVEQERIAEILNRFFGARTATS